MNDPEVLKESVVVPQRSKLSQSDKDSVSQLRAAYCSTPVQFQQAIVTSEIGGALTIYQASESTFLQVLYTQVNAMLFLVRPLHEGGQAFRQVLTTIPPSLRQGQLGRIVWREQVIALSLHEHPSGNDERFHQDIVYMQKLAAMIAWGKHSHLFSGDIIPGEEIRGMTIVDVLDVAQLLQDAGIPLQPETHALRQQEGA